MSEHANETTPQDDRASSGLSGFQKLALVTTGCTYLLIMVGGLVRAAGAGMGCPDWPRCYGLWIPPTDVSQVPPGFDPAQFNATLTWIEYFNRTFGALIGLLIVATAVVALVRYRSRPRVVWPMVATVPLLAFQVWWGSRVVASELEGWVVTLHLFGALLIVSLLLYATISALAPIGDQKPAPSPGRGRLVAVGIGVTVLAMVQTLIGALLRGTLDALVDSRVGPIRDAGLAQVGYADHVHRIVGVALVLAAVGAAVYVLRQKGTSPWLRRTAFAMVILVAAQLLVGLAMAYLSLTPTLQVAHVLTNALLLGAMTTLVLLSFRQTSIDDPPDAAPKQATAAAGA